MRLSVKAIKEAAARAAVVALQAECDRIEMVPALRWTEAVAPDVPIPDNSGYSEGWNLNSYNREVWLGWSCAVTHGRGPIPTANKYRSASQNGVRMYSTKELALKALRFEIEKQSATFLMMINRQIAAAIAESSTGETS